MADYRMMFFRLPLQVACTTLLIWALATPVLAQDTKAFHASTCAAADSLLGAPHEEDGRGLNAGYTSRTDTTVVSVFMASSGTAEAVYTAIRFAGRGPYTPPGLPLGFTFTGSSARQIAADTTRHHFLLSTDRGDAAMDLGEPVITGLNKSGSSPAITVNAILTRAVLLTLVQSSSALGTWNNREFQLSSRQLGVLRAWYRTVVCAPAGIPVDPPRR